MLSSLWNEVSMQDPSSEAAPALSSPMMHFNFQVDLLPTENRTQKGDTEENPNRTANSISDSKSSRKLLTIGAITLDVAPLGVTAAKSQAESSPELVRELENAILERSADIAGFNQMSTDPNFYSNCSYASLKALIRLFAIQLEFAPAPTPEFAELRPRIFGGGLEVLTSGDTAQMAEYVADLVEIHAWIEGMSQTNACTNAVPTASSNNATDQEIKPAEASQRHPEQKKALASVEDKSSGTVKPQNVQAGMDTVSGTIVEQQVPPESVKASDDLTNSGSEEQANAGNQPQTVSTDNVSNVANESEHEKAGFAGDEAEPRSDPAVAPAAGSSPFSSIWNIVKTIGLTLAKAVQRLLPCLSSRSAN
jgi:hypothetical protein